ncbi:RNA-binding domain-containing protein [Mediterraneibacter massiliensis]|uniref:RNA-binding domain-containing protein n=1 Tax=Mediterraneibacter massiliensis TaxID=1720300 RepID=UPI000E528761|nr:RNA-binding domain-containing protein [Mediterraneibacter massiliensis]RGT74969.1 AAA family ATPase [Ruminococcus sp. AF18-22]
MKDIKLEELDIKDLKECLLKVHEKYYIELKRASELPNAFWESYSSFSNTSGGLIVLGVTEGSPENEITGVGNKEKILTSLWNQLSNPNKVSYKNIDNQDVHTYNIDGKDVIIVHVKEAAENMKPVFIGGKLENTWIRTGDGDRKVSREELSAFIRNAQPNQDSLPAENFTMEDLDLDSVITYKERVSKRFPKMKYIEMENTEFLIKIGACYKERSTGELKIKKGTLLFLGKTNSIKEIYPHYHLDFFNHRGENPRWIDRVSDDEPSDYEMNIYNFYHIVYEKMKALLQESFSLDSGQLRIPISEFDETIREGLVNCLAHADYVQGYPSIKIDVYDGWFCFTNPGKMLVSPKQFLIGGDSRPRNEIIMKLFRLLGLSERQGFGGQVIYKTAIQNDFRRPEIITDIEHTELKVWNIDLADSYPNLSSAEKNILRYIVKSNQAQSVNMLRKALGITEYKTRKGIEVLEKSRLIRKIGKGPSTKYIVELESIEFLTQMQMAMELLKRGMV